jgi:protein-L-isoaspartate(D-aspartate) O-methyltransferase
MNRGRLYNHGLTLPSDASFCPLMTDFAAARLNMVESQLRTNKVTDPAVLAAFLGVPRENFVPGGKRGIAYIDEDLPLGGGRYLMEPMVLGRLLQLASIRPHETVLEIGCATGYASALLATLARSAVGLDSDPALVRQANGALAALGLSNAVAREGKLDRGYPERAPYDVVLVSGAVAELPGALLEQLGEGGRLVAVLRPEAGPGQAVLVTRANGTLSRRVVFDAATPLLPGLDRQPSFVF